MVFSVGTGDWCQDVFGGELKDLVKCIRSGRRGEVKDTKYDHVLTSWRNCSTFCSHENCREKKNAFRENTESFSYGRFVNFVYTSWDIQCRMGIKIWESELQSGTHNLSETKYELPQKWKWKSKDGEDGERQSRKICLVKSQWCGEAREESYRSGQCLGILHITQETDQQHRKSRNSKY